MAWHCVHCGCEISSIGADICPNCEQNPFRFEPGELLRVNPRDFRKFLLTDRVSKRARKVEKS